MVEPNRDASVKICQVWATQNDFEYKGWRLRYIDGKEVKDWFAGPRLHEYSDLPAGEGWQVAAACSGQAMFGHADKYQVFFKHPR